MTEPALRLLVSLLRARPARRADLPALGLDDGPLDELIRAGFVAQTGDRLSYDEPAAVLARQARATADLIAVLPALAREWRNHPRTTVGVELVHGHEEQWRAWARHAALTPPRAPINLYPSLEVLRDVIAPSLADVAGPYPEGMRQARAVLPAAAVVTDDDRAVIDVLIRTGLRVRLARRVESWLYSDPEVLCALPLTWGEDPPPSIMIVHDPAIRALTAAYCETVWRAAAPYRTPKPEFHEVLRMLALGMSDRAIATAQCTSQRTVERRIAEAMAHYAVGTRFELGMAWSAEQVDEG
ncbi:helix-turn-helix transcriptional regulator [Actinoplanes flavus]|uniref:HTH luxR-type domain-containing protein n=1 Tax=Actinoplanes flavus TaxID=2820290 RepID=A0ABS3UX28_9ACTN|nr:hypothetical protein [Actinoplanes flavus]MBO3743133.1 hypothetical protein [Actinoplanes flavus]